MTVVLIKYAAYGNPFGGFGFKVKKNNLQKQTGSVMLITQYESYATYIVIPPADAGACYEKIKSA